MGKKERKYTKLKNFWFSEEDEANLIELARRKGFVSQAEAVREVIKERVGAVVQ